MQNLQLTLDSPAENLALDEALLDAAEADEIQTDILRLWELPTYCVVLGRSSNEEVEVDLAACRAEHVPVLRRASGGGTILAGPGCLMYSLVLGFAEWTELPPIDQAHTWVLGRLSQMLSSDSLSVQPAGTSDLTLHGNESGLPIKFSGNAMRRKRRHLLYHGTLLYSFDLARISRLLSTATRTPDYRGERTHEQFVANLPISREALINRLVCGWQAEHPCDQWPRQRVQAIVRDKYTDNSDWIPHLKAT